MPIGERFKEYAQNSDSRFIELERLRMNCEASSPVYSELETGGYFEVLKELMTLFPITRTLETYKDIPYLEIHTKQHLLRDRDEFLSINLEILLGSNNHLWIVSAFPFKTEGHGRKRTEAIKERIPREFSRERLEGAVFRVLAAAGIFVGKGNQSNGNQERKSTFMPQDQTDLHGHYQALRLHTSAFDGLSPEEAEELLKNAHHFAVKRSHPDVGGDNQEMQRVNNARDALRNQILRKMKK